jgi:hypothetical protein
MELQFLKPASPFASALLLYLSASLFFACEERIRIHTEASSPRLVIYGYVTTDTARHGVRITRSTDYFSAGRPEGISGASVSIRCKEEAYTLAEDPSDPGYYQMETPVPGQTGETYTLQVSLDFNGDGQTETYEAASLLPPVAQLDSIAIAPSVLSEHFLEVLIWGLLPPGQENNYFSFHLYRDGHLVNDSLQGFSIANDEFLNSKTIQGLPAFYLNQQRGPNILTPGSLVTFQMEGITREYSLFITNAQSENRGAIPLFSAPPANLETNIRSLAPSGDIPVSGFFTACSKARISTVYR